MVLRATNFSKSGVFLYLVYFTPNSQTRHSTISQPNISEKKQLETPFFFSTTNTGEEIFFGFRTPGAEGGSGPHRPGGW